MNDTVMKLLSLADEYAAARYEQGYARVYTNGDVIGTRQALQDELTRLFTPLTDEQIGAIERGLPIDDYAHDLTRRVERLHGIKGESK